MKNKIILIGLIVAFVLCLTGASLGYYENKARSKEPIIKKNGTITYEYYLENELKDKESTTNPVTKDELGEDVVEVKYVFSRFECTNGVKGYFDETKWEFVPAAEAEATCKLYFSRANYNVTFTITNGEEAEDNVNIVNRESNGIFVLNPNEGYEFDSYKCTNDKEAIWDKATNKFTLNAVMNDITCKVVFKIKELSADIIVKNGTGTTTEVREYGETVTSIVTPDEGYEKPTIKCTNSQSATFSKNTITIEKLTDNTKCTVTFKVVAVKSYSLKISLTEHVKIVNGEATQTITSGGDGTFSLKADDGYSIDGIDCGGITPVIVNNEDGSIKYTFNGIEKNISCTVDEKASE